MKNQKGFTGLEIILVIVALGAIGTAGYFAYEARRDNTGGSATVEKTAGSDLSNKTSKTSTAANDKEDIIAAVKEYDPDAKTVTVETIIGVNAKGSVSHEGEGSHASFYANKSEGNWIVVLITQQQPGKNTGEKYGFPVDWYTNEYDDQQTQ